MKLALLDFNKETKTTLSCQPLLGDAKHLNTFIKHCNLVVTSPPYWSAQNYEENQRLSFDLFNLKTEEGSEIGRNRNAYLSEMGIVFNQIKTILDGYFAIIMGEDNDKKMHEEIYDVIIKTGFRHVDTVKRRISNQSSRAKQIQQEYIYLFKN